MVMSLGPSNMFDSLKTNSYRNTMSETANCEIQDVANHNRNSIILKILSLKATNFRAFIPHDFLAVLKMFCNFCRQSN